MKGGGYSLMKRGFASGTVVGMECSVGAVRWVAFGVQGEALKGGEFKGRLGVRSDDWVIGSARG